MKVSSNNAISMTRSRLTASAKVLFSSMVVAGLVAACGGGGHTNTTTTMTTTPPPPPTITKALWIANGTAPAANILEYLPSQLTGGVSTANPHLMNESKSLGAPQGVTFDSKGNMWVMDPAATVNGVANTPALLEFSAAQVAALGTNAAPTPIATITTLTLAFPQQAVFDAQGNMWVTDHNANNVLVFTPNQLALTGTNMLTPAVTLTSPAFNGPLGIVFDAKGNLFVANNGGVPNAQGGMSAVGASIVEFYAAKLQNPAAMLAPDATFNDNGANTIQAPWALTFDNNGDLWSSNSGGTFTLVKFAKADLAKPNATTPMPTVTISPTNVPLMGAANNVVPSLVAPNGICFDNLFDLAAADADSPFGIAFYKNNQLTSGAVLPNTFFADLPATITAGTPTPLNAPAGCNFGPLVN
jgi:sugar lactone lactonase YvrE